VENVVLSPPISICLTRQTIIGRGNVNTHHEH
jgi:hypothetical protein